MKRTILAVGVMLSVAGSARAQFNVAGPGWHGGFVHRGGFAFGVGGPGFRFGAFGGGFYSRSVVVAPPVYGWGPGFADPFFFAPPPVFVVPPPVVFAGNAEPEELPPPAPPLRRPGEMVVFRPRKDVPPDEGVIVPKLDRVAPPPAPPTFKFDPFAPIDLGKIERPDPDPATESARRMKLARAAFAAHEYGKAAEHLTAASKARPDDALPHFLKAQVRFAAGQFAESVASVRDGMKLAPDWPNAPFKAKELYGDAALFDVHLTALRDAADANPTEPTLAFLLGYQQWFAGEREASRKLFAALAPRVKDAGEVERFLRVPLKP